MHCRGVPTHGILRLRVLLWDPTTLPAPAAGENWVAANKVGCDANVDPRLGSPMMQAPSFTGDGAGRFSELGATIEGSGPYNSNSNGTPAVHTSQSSKQSDANRSAAPPPMSYIFIASSSDVVLHWVF